MTKLGKYVRELEDQHTTKISRLAAEYGNASLPVLVPKYGKLLVALYTVAEQRRILLDKMIAKGFVLSKLTDLFVEQKKAFTSEVKLGKSAIMYGYLRNGLVLANPNVQGFEPSNANHVDGRTDGGRILGDLGMSNVREGGGKKLGDSMLKKRRRPSVDSDEAKSISSVGTDVKVKRPRVERALLKA
jgi:hypothetical protein